MKYIKNESGIYEVVSSNSRSTEFIYPTKNGIRFCYRQNKKCKFADTIEELCDYWDFYFISDSEYLVRSIKEYTIKQIKNMLSEGYIKDVNLAIRTDKGLIYVAKMNDKGELELL